MRRALALVRLLPALLLGCGTAPADGVEDSQPLVVFAAASLTDAFTEIGAAFEASHPGVDLMFSFAGSQTLRTQIEAGAPTDVFASANVQEMSALVASGVLGQDTPRIFATNRLLIILPSSNPAHLQEPQDLARPGLKLVLAAEDVPVGRYTREALGNMNADFGADFEDRVLSNVVSNEDNVKQVVAKVQLGEGDAGIVYSSDAVAAPDLRTIEILVEANVLAQYPIAVLSNSGQAALARRFVDYLLSPEGQTLLRKWGFGPAY